MTQLAHGQEDSAAAKAAALDVAAVSLNFGGVQALDTVSFSVLPRSKCALIGPNGAGKTTLFNCINGLVQPQSGSIRLNGEELTRIKPHEVFPKGITRTFQGIALVRDMSVLENVMTGAAMGLRRGVVMSGLAIPSFSSMPSVCSAVTLPVPTSPTSASGFSLASSSRVCLSVSATL